ncbi:MAG: hypothetical protein ACK58T_36480, partial [Phycisphaerae bacterium]
FDQLAQLTKDLNEIMPVVKQIAPQFPEISNSGIEALNEMVIVLQAMQKSFILQGSTQKVLEERRKPASP